MPFLAGLGRFIQTLDYGLVLPAMGRLPLGMGARLSRVRGLFQGVLDYEWRSVAFGKRFVRAHTFEALVMLMPGASKWKQVIATLRRFEHNGLEEWQACLLGRRPVMDRIARDSVFEGFDNLSRINQQGRGLVMASCHYDSFAMGMALLGLKGLKVNFLASAVVEHPRVHPRVRDFFDLKYSGMGECMGGRTVYWERDMSYCREALDRGEVVVVLVDIPGNKSDVRIPFLGRSFRMPLGPWQLAKETGSAVGGYVCLYERPGVYRLRCTGPHDAAPADPAATMGPVYAFLENRIREAPERWLAADLLPGYGHMV